MPLTGSINGLLGRPDLLAKERARRRRASLLAFVRSSFPGYKAGWVHEDICRRLERFSDDVAAGLSPRLMLTVPPRHGKSIIASERFPPWHLGRYPQHQIAVASYGQALSNRFSKRARGVAETDLMRETFPDFKLDADRQAVEEWLTVQGGGYRAVGIGGGLTGTGADILIIDDPVKNAADAMSLIKRDGDWEWYTTTGYTRLMPGGGVLVIMTRWHEDDLAGRLLKAMQSGDGDQWEIINYPAIAERDEPHRKAGEALHPERYDLRKLDRIKRAIGTRSWEALYQQNPTPPQGNLVKKTWWKTYKVAPTRFDRVVTSWDCTFKGGTENDWVVGLVVGQVGADKYVLARYRGQIDFVTTLAEVRTLAQRFPNAIPILIEDKANGPAVINTLQSKVPGIVAVSPEGSKESRAAAISPGIEAGNWHLPEDAAWLDEFRDEWAQFPRGAHDDQVDATSQAGLYLGEEGKTAVFSDLHTLFGQPQVYVVGNRVAVPDNHKGAFVGVKWGGNGGEHTFIALDRSGEMMGAHTCGGHDAVSAVAELRGFMRRCAGDGNAPVVIAFESTGPGAPMLRILEDDRRTPWYLEPTKLAGADVDAMVSSMKAAMEAGDVKPRNWLPLYDQMSKIRTKETDKGLIQYEAPAGFSINAVLAFALAAHALKTRGAGLGNVQVFDQFEAIRKIYSMED